MRKALVALTIVTLVVTGIVGCARVKPTTVTLPAAMKTYYVSGDRTSEAVFLKLEIGWLELETG